MKMKRDPINTFISGFFGKTFKKNKERDILFKDFQIECLKTHISKS